MKVGAILTVVALVACVIVGVLVLTPLFQPKPAGPFVDKCGTPPEDAVLAEKTFKLSGVSLDKIAIGDLEVSNKPEVFRALTHASRNILVVNYLICAAEQRGEINANDPDQVDHLRQMFSYLQTNPTSADYQKWLKDNPLPKQIAHLDLPDMQDNGKDRVLYFYAADTVKTIRLINAGGSSIKVWLEGFPKEIFYPIPDEGPWTITPTGAQELTIVFRHVKPRTRIYPFKFHIAGGQDIEARIVISSLSSASLYDDVTRQLASDLGGHSGPPSTTLAIATNIVSSHLPSLSNAAKSVVAWQALSEISQPHAALLALKNLEKEEPSSKKNFSYFDLLAKTYRAAGQEQKAVGALRQQRDLALTLPMQ